MAKKETYFLPYQKAWLADTSRIKIINKSRRIGFTYVQAYEDVKDAAMGKCDVWFSSSDLGNAAGYIDYCKKWASILNMAAKDLGFVVVDSEQDYKAYRIEFSSGKRITALSSSPKALRGKGGKIVLDEFAYHDNPIDMWRAAKPATMWGFPLRILSTPNGKNSLFWHFLHDIEIGKLNHWSRHVVDIYTAVDQGLFDKISGRKTTVMERADWIASLQQDSRDHDTFLQEYCCHAVDESTAFLTYEMLELVELDNIYKKLDEVEGELFIGMDIGRKKHWSVIWVLERLGHQLYTVHVKQFQKTAFATQREYLWSLLKHPKLFRACIDASGLGMQLAEESQNEFGKYRVEGITFSAKIKEDMAYTMRHRIEDRTLYIPRDQVIREDFHSVRKTVTAAGNIRLDAAETDDGHADHFWACALACHAAKTDAGPIIVRSGQRRSMPALLDRFIGRTDYSRYK